MVFFAFFGILVIMKKIGLLLFITFTFPFFAAAEETGGAGGLFTQWQKSLEEFKVPGIPAFFVKKVNSYLVGIGFLFNSPESFGQNSPFRSLLEEFPLFQAAFLLQDKTISSSIVFSYEKNNTWGLSAKLSF